MLPDGATKSAWKKVFFEYFLMPLVATAVLAVAVALWARLRTQAQIYDPVVLATFVTAFLVFFAWDYILFRRTVFIRYVWILYSASAVVFLLLTAYARHASVRAYIPMLAAVTLAGVAKLYSLTAMHHSATTQRQLAENVGFAVTGIVICTSNPEEPHFILVFNRNLRGGKGLWVPPGGHFIPHQEEPTEKLLFKVTTEIGVKCTIINTFRHLRVTPEQLSTDHAKWILAPVFLLDEDLMGRCSHGHEVHLDSVYLLTTDGAITEPVHKYPKTQQVTVPVASCVAGPKEAENAILAAIEGWHVQTSGARPALKETLTNDVVWRLHLSSLLFERFVGENK